jgi:hypothetical protein
LAVWYSLWSFVIFSPIWNFWAKKKSGNPGVLDNHPFKKASSDDATTFFEDIQISDRQNVDIKKQQ